MFVERVVRFLHRWEDAAIPPAHPNYVNLLKTPDAAAAKKLLPLPTFGSMFPAQLHELLGACYEITPNWQPSFIILKRKTCCPKVGSGSSFWRRQQLFGSGSTP